MQTDILIPSDSTIASILNGTEQFDEYGTVALDITPEQKSSAIQKIMDGSEIVNKTVFLKPRFGAIGNSRKVSGSDVLETDADVTLLKVSKTLLDSPELDAIKKADAMMRKWLYNTCLPFEMGVLLLPYGLIDSAVERMEKFKAERAALVETFVAAYPSRCAEVASRLGTQFNQADYPTVEEIKSKFTFDYNIMSFSVPGHLKSISKALFDAEKNKQAAQFQVATEEITSLMRETMVKLVSHLQERLSPGDEGKPKQLRESAVKNLTEFLATFDMRNVTNDTELAAQVSKARALLTGADVKTIRSSDETKTKILSGLDGIMDSLSGMVEVKPGRMFREED